MTEEQKAGKDRINERVDVWTHTMENQAEAELTGYCRQSTIYEGSGKVNAASLCLSHKHIFRSSRQLYSL